MSRPLTLEDLKRINTGSLVLPALSAKLGEEVEVTFGSVQRLQWVACWPPALPGQETWTPEEFGQRLAEWQRDAPQEERFAYESGWAAARAMICAKAVKSPALTVEAALDLGPDLDVLTVAILRLSGIIDTPPSPAPEPAPEPAEESAAELVPA